MSSRTLTPANCAYLLGNNRSRYMVTYKQFEWEGKHRVEVAVYVDISDTSLHTPRGAYKKQISRNFPLLNHNLVMTLIKAIDTIKEEKVLPDDFGSHYMPSYCLTSEQWREVRANFVVT